MRVTIFAKASLLVTISILLMAAALTFTVRYVITRDYDRDALKTLKIHKGTINEYADSVISGIRSSGQLLASNSAVGKAMLENDSALLRQFIVKIQESTPLDFITIADMSGKVIARSHIPASRDGESVAGQALARAAMQGQSAFGLQSANSSKLTARAANPIFVDGKQVGFVMLGQNLANDEFVDHLKKMLNAEVTIFIGDVREATTLVENGKRTLGTRLTNQQILNDTLTGGKDSIIRIKLFGENYDAIYFPIRDISGNIFGMFFVGVKRSLVEDMVSSTLYYIMGIGGIIVVLMAVVGTFIAHRTISKPLNKSSSAIARMVDGSADLNERLDESGSDELAALNHEVNRLMGKVENILFNVEGFRNMVNAIPDMVFTVDDNYRVILANNAICTATGRANLESVYGKHINDVLGVDFYDTERCPLRQTMQEKKRVISDNFALILKGKKAWVKAMSDEVRDANGGKVGYLQVLSDVTSLVEKEDELRQRMELIQSVNAEVAAIAGSVSTTSQAVRQQSTEIQDSATTQNSLLTKVLYAVSQINDALLSVSRNIAHASTQAEAGQSQAQKGAKVVADSIKSIDLVRNLTESLRINLHDLGQQADAIGQIMDVISDIADQTNLLALNAAIEAARAGEAGRGFAVVAGEVRKLAEKTAKATQEVRQSVESIQRGTTSNIQNMDEVAKAVDSATSLAKNSGEALQAIVPLVNDTAEQVHNIAAATEEQSAATAEIKQSVEQVVSLAEDALSQTAGSVQSAIELSDLADKLYEVTRG